MTNSKFISNTAAFSEWYIIVTKWEHRKYQHVLISRDFFMNSLRRNTISAELTAGKDPESYTVPFRCRNTLQWFKSSVRHSPEELIPLQSLSCLGKEMTASLKPRVSYQSLGMCSLLYFSSSCMAALNPEEQMHKRLNLTCEADPKTSALWAVRLWWVFHLSVLLHLDKGTDQTHAVNAHYASIGTVSLQLSDICFSTAL